LGLLGYWGWVVLYFLGELEFVVDVELHTEPKTYKPVCIILTMERTTSYWKYYWQKQKAEKLSKELKDSQKQIQNLKEQISVYTRLLFALIRFLRGDIVDSERLSRYRKALLDLKRIAKPEDYNIIAPICEKAIAELEKRLKERPKS
jgi:hypothetical protein